jgi:phage tail-like protein
MPDPTPSLPYYPPTGFYFRVQVADGGAGTAAGGSKLDVAFQDASGISVEIEPETVAEGGLNTYRHRLPTAPKYGDLVLKRGYVSQSLPLFQWCQKTIQGGLGQPIVTKVLSLQLLAPGDADSTASILRQWSFYGAWPTKWNLSDFGSAKSDVVIETLQFAYRYFETN